MLRRGSGKKAAAPKAPKAPKSKAPRPPGVALPKAKNDAYTAMLAVAVGALLVACLMLFLEWRRFG